MAISLASIQRGKVLRPPRIIVHGEHKVGKSTFAASAPNPIFIKTEDGLDNIATNSFPLAKSYPEVIESIGELFTQPHDFATVCVDSLDWLERLIWSHTCAVGEKNSIEDFGYGKGYLAALTYWQEFIDGLDALRDKRGMAVICLAHTHIKRFDAPDVESYDQYKIKMHDRASALMQEWADVIGFAAEDTFTKKSEVKGGKEITRAVSSGKRYLHMRGKPSFQAGNRYNLPAKVELSWPHFLGAFNAACTPAEQPTAEAA